MWFKNLSQSILLCSRLKLCNGQAAWN